MTIIDQIREIRYQQRLKQWQVAERAGMMTKRYQEIESGYRMPTLRTLTRITDALGIELTVKKAEVSE